MPEVWELVRIVVDVDGEEHEIEPPLTKAKIYALAKKYGLVRFTVETEDGRLLKPSDFPVEEGKYFIKPHHEAK